MRPFFALLFAVCFSVMAFGNTPEDDVNAYLAIFNGDANLHVAATQELAWKGISDPRLYDVIEQKILTEANLVREDKLQRDRVNSYIRALGYSGQSKYIATIQTLLDDPVYRENAIDAERNIPDHQKWNLIISNRSTFNAQYSDDVNRGINMLRSDDMELKRLGARAVYISLPDITLFNVLAEEVKKYAFMPKISSRVREPIAWLVKSLGLSTQEEHRALLLQVKENCTDHVIARQARKALERDDSKKTVKVVTESGNE